MLEDFEDFDASRLEELAESLLAGVTSEFEDDVTKGGHRTTQIEGKPKSMFRPMVGSKAENLESSKNTNGSVRMPNNNNAQHSTVVNTIKKEISDCGLSTDDDVYVSNAPNAPTNQMQFMQMNFDHTKFSHSGQMFNIDNNNKNNGNRNITATKSTRNTDKSMIFCQNASDNTTDNHILYETTYDDDGNIITVILPDEDISNFEEVIEEISNHGEEDEYMSHVSALSPIPSACYASPGSSLNGSHSDDPATASDHDSAYDSVINSPPGKLPSSWSSPTSMDDDYQCGDYWSQDSFSVLFPSLA